MSEYEYRRFGDIPVDETFADKFGRMWTKTSVASARSHGQYVNDWWTDKFDTSRDYYEADEEELDDCDVFDAWPYYRVQS